RIVCIDGRAILHIVEDRVLQSLPLDIGDNHGANLTEIAVENSHNYGLVLIWSKAIDLETATLVHILSQAADKCFVGFNRSTFTTTKLAASESALAHSLSQPLKHEPCRLLGNAQGRGQFVRANPVL